MKNLNYLDKYRVDLYGNKGNERNGAFEIPTKNGKHILLVIASDGMEWDHVSVTMMTLSGDTLERCPRWNEMCYVKDLFFEENETVVQYHPAKGKYVNKHPYCLHLWKPNEDICIPVPPSFLV